MGSGGTYTCTMTERGILKSVLTTLVYTMGYLPYVFAMYPSPMVVYGENGTKSMTYKSHLVH